jgi:hypothetical protein
VIHRFPAGLNTHDFGWINFLGMNFKHASLSLLSYKNLAMKTWLLNWVLIGRVRYSVLKIKKPEQAELSHTTDWLIISVIYKTYCLLCSMCCFVSFFNLLVMSVCKT